MDESLARRVWRRAGDACEYCHMPQALDPAPFEIDHIISKQHRGPTTLANLALSCYFCNSHKGPNIAGLDPETGKLTKLFNPRRQKWNRHFRWEGPLLVGRTPIGRVTIAVLAINDPYRLAFRKALVEEGRFRHGRD
jgi:HNH endonuclease